MQLIRPWPMRHLRKFVLFFVVLVATNATRSKNPAFVTAFGIGILDRPLSSVIQGTYCRFNPPEWHKFDSNLVSKTRFVSFFSLASSSRNREEGVLNSNGATETFLQHMFRERGCQGEQGDVQVRLDEKTGRRGIYVTSEDGIAEGDYVFAIPLNSTWVVEKSGDNSNSGSNELTDAEKGLLFLKWQQEQSSDESDMWKPYKGILPTREQDFDPTPDFWSEEQILALELPQAFQGALSKKKSVQALAEQEGVDANELRFATWIVSSRAITMIDDNGEEEDPISNEDEDDEYFDNLTTTCAMVPLLDMINHSSGNPNAYFAILGDDGDDGDEIETFFSEDNDGGSGEHGDNFEESLYYAVVADRDLRKGEEILISYGSEQDSSIDLLLQYGFVPETNPYDVEFWEAFWEENDGEDDFTWTTSLQEDEDRLAGLEKKEGSAIERTILEFRIRMKRAHADWTVLSDRRSTQIR